MNRAIFLDRDGVINRKMPEGDYVKNWKEFEFLPEVKETLSWLAEKDYKIIVITNQRGIARGKLTIQDLDEIHDLMISEIKKSGGRIDDVLYCPHDNNQCACRKPLPGLLLIAQEKHHVSLLDSILIGDSLTDIAAGRAAGVGKTFLLSEERETGNYETAPDYVIQNLKQIMSYV